MTKPTMELVETMYCTLVDGDGMDKADALLSEISQRLEAMEREAARLDSGSIVTNERDDFGYEYQCVRRGLNLRAAIDAAMAEGDG